MLKNALIPCSKTLGYFFFLLVLCFQIPSSKAQNPDTEWFEDGRYGMFIHWGLYSAAEGLWKGEKLRYLNDYAEWIRYRNRISKEEYGELAKRIDWAHLDPEEWVLQAKKAGMKYIIITAKHHDGVALWDTEVDDYSLPKLAGTDRDVIKEITDAAKKHDVKIGFYYSHWIDWTHPYAWDHNQELTGQVSDEEYDQYWQEKVIPQLKELLTDYGDIALMWFDMWLPYQESIIKKEQLVQAASLIRDLQPDALINSRLGLPPKSEYVDFETFGDNTFGSSYTDHPWETPGTIAYSWGYHGQETEWKSIAQIFNSLISNISLNGGYTLNIGPRADGSIPYESQTRLDEIGNWLDNYGEAVYGNTGLKLRANQHDWGEVTYNEKEDAVYLHVFNWPLDGTLRVSGLKNTPQKIELLEAEGTSTTLNADQHGPLLHIELPSKQPNPYNSIIRIKTKDIALDKDIVGESSFGGFSLNSSNALNKEALDSVVSYDGKNPEHTVVKNESVEWAVYLPEKGSYTVDLSAHNPTKQEVPVLISIGEKTLEGLIKPDGQVVAEPNEDNYTEEFADRPIDVFELSEPQKLNVTFTSKDGDEIWLNYIWIKKE